MALKLALPLAAAALFSTAAVAQVQTKVTDEVGNTSTVQAEVEESRFDADGNPIDAEGNFIVQGEVDETSSLENDDAPGTDATEAVGTDISPGIQ
ncbi:MAG: hypothetical protein AAFQ42_15130 [Pseudomonadota bacterium]